MNFGLGLLAETHPDPLGCGIAPCLVGATTAPLPKTHTQATSPIRSQSVYPTCVAFAVSDAIEDIDTDFGDGYGRPSEWWLHWHIRRIDGTLGHDIGGRFSSGIRALRESGAPSEKSFPYSEGTPFTSPPFDAQSLAWPKQNMWKMFPVMDDIPRAIHSGARIVGGFVLDQTFQDGETIKNGESWRAEGSSIGAHAIRIIGYKNENGVLSLLCKNSWGEDWGLGGLFWVDARVLFTSKFLGAWEIAK